MPETAQDHAGRVLWGLTMDVKVAGIALPFRLRVTSDDEERILEALADFQAEIQRRIAELS